MTCHAPFFLLLFLIFLFCPALFFENSTEEIELPRLLNSTTVRHDSKIAICLVGELRAFEMTGELFDTKTKEKKKRRKKRIFWILRLTF